MNGIFYYSIHIIYLLESHIKAITILIKISQFCNGISQLVVNFQSINK